MSGSLCGREERHAGASCHGYATGSAHSARRRRDHSDVAAASLAKRSLTLRLRGPAHPQAPSDMPGGGLGEQLVQVVLDMQEAAAERVGVARRDAQHELATSRRPSATRRPADRRSRCSAGSRRCRPSPSAPGRAPSRTRGRRAAPTSAAIRSISTTTRALRRRVRRAVAGSARSPCRSTSTRPGRARARPCRAGSRGSAGPAPRRLTSKSRHQASGGTSSNRPQAPASPALLTSRSIGPRFGLHLCGRGHHGGRVGDVARDRRGPGCRAAGGVTRQRRCAPARARSAASVTPMPRVPPVTTATWPARSTTGRPSMRSRARGGHLGDALGQPRQRRRGARRSGVRAPSPGPPGAEPAVSRPAAWRAAARTVRAPVRTPAPTSDRGRSGGTARWPRMSSFVVESLR